MSARAAASRQSDRPAVEDKARVFVSYSRKDADFAIWLQRGLAEHGIAVFRDIEDTLPGEEWWRRLQDLISRSDTVVFVLSPNSADSAVCRDEVAYAQKLNKRIFPAVIADIDWASVPDGLAKIHSVFFNEVAGRDAALGHLVEALETDIVWIREHTRLGELAQHWDAQRRPTADLLRRRALEEAERWLTQRPATARSPTNLHQEFIQASRTAARRRGRLVVAGSLAVAIATSAIGAVAYLQRLEAEQQRSEAERQRSQAQRNAHMLSVENSRMLTEFAKQNLRDGDPVTAVLLAVDALPDREEKSERPYYPPAELVLRAGLRGRNERLVLGGTRFIMRAAVFSPDGKRILTAENDGRARMWDAASGSVIATLHGQPNIGARTAAYSPDGRRVLIGDDDGVARVWDAETRAPLLEVKAGGKSLRVGLFSRDGRRFLTAGLDGTAAVWDGTSGRPIFRLTHQGAIESASFSRDGRKIVTASHDRTARVWDADTGEALAMLSGHGNNVGTAVFSADGERVLTASDDGTARIWDAATGQELDKLVDHEAAVRFADFSRDGRRIVTTSQDKTVRLWDSQIGRGGAQGARTHTLVGHTDNVRTAAFSDDGALLVTVSDDRSARIWDVKTGTQVAVFKGHEALISSAVFSRDGQTVLTASEDKTARTWTVQPKPDVIALEEDDEVLFATFNRDGALLATTSDDGTARVWNVVTGKAGPTLKGHDDRAVAADLSPDGKRVATASHDGTARVWEVDSARKLHVLEIGGRVNGVVHSPDGSLILTFSNGGSTMLWDSASREKIREFKSDASEIFGASFSPDGRRILTASANRTARLWDVDTGKLVTLFEGHTGPCRSAVFSPDARRVVTAGDTSARLWNSADGTLVDVFNTAKDLRDDARGANVLSAAFVRDGRGILMVVGRKPYVYLWDVESGKAVELSGHDNPVTKAAVSPDGRRVVTASNDGTVRLWDAQTGGAVDELKGHGKRVLHVAFAPDGRGVVTTSSDRTARLWRTFVSTQELIDVAKREVPRCLTPEQRRDRYGLDDDAPWCKRLRKWPFVGD